MVTKFFPNRPADLEPVLALLPRLDGPVRAPGACAASPLAAKADAADAAAALSVATSA